MLRGDNWGARKLPPSPWRRYWRERGGRERHAAIFIITSLQISCA